MQKEVSKQLNMPNSKKYKYSININFFEKWTPKMAYILGFTAADGNVYKTTLAWDLTDKEPANRKLLEKINKTMNSTYPIKKRGNSYRLRISNPKIIHDIQQLEIVPNKKKILQMPKIPKEYKRHFLRGFLDGDGWITTRIKNNSKEISIGFSNGSEKFSKSLVKMIENELNIKSSNLRKRKKITKNKVISVVFQLEYYAKNANKIIFYLYNNLSKEDLYLESKYKKHIKAKKYFQETLKISSKTKSWFNIEKKLNINIKEYLYSELIIKNKLPIQIARNLNVSLATIYRWLEKTKIRIPNSRTKNEKN